MNDALEKLMFEELRNACRGGAALLRKDEPHSSSHVKCCFIIDPGVGGFLPAMKQIGNVAALPGIVHVGIILQSLKIKLESKSDELFSILPQKSIGLPDVHSGYGFAIGNMAAFDMNDPAAVVSPGALWPFHYIRTQKSIFEELQLSCRWCRL